MLLYAGMMEGYLIGMERNILDLEVGDLQVFADDYRKNPSIFSNIPDPDSLLKPLAEAGFPASGRLLAYGLAAADEASSGVSLRGLEVEPELGVSRIHEQIAAGSWLDPSDPKGVVMGRRLAHTLGVELGDEVVLLSQGTDSAMAIDLYRVRGVLRGIGDATDRTGVFMTADAFRELLILPKGVHQIVVRRPPGLPLSEAATQVSRVARGLDVQTWRQLKPTIASLLDSSRAAMFVMFFIVYIAIAILILNAMLMAVFERIRELGVLKALGAGPLDILRLIVAESAIQIGIAIGVGLLLGVPALFYLTRVGIDLGSLAGISIVGIALDPVWRATMNAQVFTSPVLTLVAIASVAAFYPAMKAAWIRPVDAMRHH
jgi:ABC-type lipoprotein release transport system permease subunit